MKRAWLVLVLAACSSTPGATSATDPREAIEAIVLGRKVLECRTGAECASGVCSVHACVPLVAANEAWMEVVMAGRLREVIGDRAEARTVLADTLAELVDGPDPYTQAHVAGLLGELGDAAFLPELRRLAASPVEIVAARARISLGRLADEASFQPVKTLLAHPSEAVALQAAEAVAAYASTDHAAEVTRTLLSLLDHGSYRVRLRAIRLLGRSGAAEPAVFDALERILRSEADGYLQQDAFKAIVTLDPSRYESAAALIRP